MHLTDLQLMACLDDEADDVTRRHLASCPTRQARLASYRAFQIDLRQLFQRLARLEGESAGSSRAGV